MGYALDRQLIIQDLSKVRRFLNPEILDFVMEQAFNPLRITQQNFMILNNIHDEILAAMYQEKE